MFPLLTSSKSKKSQESSAKTKKAMDAIKKKAEDFERMRKDAGFSRDELAMLLYKDPSKSQRVGKIERGEVQPTFFEGLSWLKQCSVGVDREEVMNAIETLERTAKR